LTRAGEPEKISSARPASIAYRIQATLRMRRVTKTLVHEEDKHVKMGIRAIVVAFVVTAATVLAANVAIAAPALFPFH
jgi:hypothetical protein